MYSHVPMYSPGIIHPYLDTGYSWNSLVGPACGSFELQEANDGPGGSVTELQIYQSILAAAIVNRESPQQDFDALCIVQSLALGLTISSCMHNLCLSSLCMKRLKRNEKM